MKNIKRAMAGEYSRELSAKVFTGQCRLIRLGYRQGGPAGYGLRRHLVNERDEPKAPLARGEHKSLQTDRVILVPGPEDEIRTVERIYRLFVLQRRSEREIAETTTWAPPPTLNAMDQVNGPVIPPTRNTSVTTSTTVSPTS